LQPAALIVVGGGVPADAGGFAEVVVPRAVVVVLVLDDVEVWLAVFVGVDERTDVPHAARTAVTIPMPAATVTRFTVRSLSAPPQRVIGWEATSPLRRTSYKRSLATPPVVLTGYAWGASYAGRGTEKASP
jgi:hypothetical protein